MVCARAAPKEGVLQLWLYHIKPFARLFLTDLRVGIMEQSSGSILTCMRAFFAHLPLTSLLCYCCGLHRSTALGEIKNALVTGEHQCFGCSGLRLHYCVRLFPDPRFLLLGYSKILSVTKIK